MKIKSAMLQVRWYIRSWCQAEYKSSSKMKHLTHWLVDHKQRLTLQTRWYTQIIYTCSIICLPSTAFDWSQQTTTNITNTNHIYIAPICGATEALGS